MKTNLIALSGKIGSGKNTVASIIQYLVWKQRVEQGSNTSIHLHLDDFLRGVMNETQSGWAQKSFAGKLKQIASILTGIPVEKFEDQEFKKTYLGEEWGSFTFVEHWINDNYATFEGEVLFSKKEEMEKYASDMGHTDNTCSQRSFRVPTIREFLQKLGTEAIRNNIHPNAWVNALFADYNGHTPQAHDLKDWSELYTHKSCNICGKQFSGYKRQYQCKECIEEHAPFYPNWIITDCRFPNEFEAVKKRNGVVVRVDRADTVQNNHASETALDNHQFDYTIQNVGTIDDLVTEVEKMLKHFSIL